MGPEDPTNSHSLAQRLFVDRPAEALRWISILTLVFGAGIVLLELRTDGGSVYPDDDETVGQTLTDSETFSDSLVAIVLSVADPGSPPIASPVGMRELATLHERLESIPEVDADGVRSVANLLDPESSESIVELTRYFDTLPNDSTAFEEWLANLRTFPLVDGLLLSRDGRAAAFYVPIAESHDRGDFIAALDAWVDANQSPGRTLRLTGPVTAEVKLGRKVMGDLVWLVPIMVVAMGVLLFCSLGTWGGVLIPLAEVLIVLIWTFGTMGYAGVPITLVTTILPVVLMAMAVTDEIHLLERFQARLAASHPAASESEEELRHRDAMLAAIRDVRQPVVLTSLTTSAGFLAFLTASMAPIQHFGIFAAFGITIAMLATFSFVPALVGVLPHSFFAPRTRRSREGAARPPLHERWALRRPRGAFLLALLLIAAGAPGIAKLSVQDSWIGNFDPRSPLASAERDFNDRFWGSYRFDVVLRAPEERFFQRREGLKLLSEVREAALADPHASGFASHLVPYGIVTRAIGAKPPASELTESKLLRVTALAWSGRDNLDLAEYMEWGGRSARARIFVRNADYARGRALGAYLEDALPAVLEPAGVSYHFSGDLPVATAVVDAIVRNQLRSIGWASAGVILLLIAAFRSVRLAVVAIAPLAGALPLVFGAMGHFDVPLGIASSMFAALVIGVGVDFALHFLHAYRRARGTGESHDAALRETFASSGRAIRWNATVLSLGFAILTLSHLKPNHSLGWLLCTSMLACYAMTVLLMPLLLSRSAPRGL